MVRRTLSNLLGKVTIFFAWFVLLSIGSGAVVGKTIHVKVGGTGDGSNWDSAYGDLQSALDDANPNDEIWVAEGTYVPTELFDPYDPRSVTFQMKNNVGIYGGFSNMGDPNWEDRDWEGYETILSGDLLGNDMEVGDPWDLIEDPCRVENCYHVFYHPEGTNLDTNSVLDGFTITGSNNDGASSYDPNCNGGGMYNYQSDPMVNNCRFSGNLVMGGFESFGSGMYNENSNPTITNCIFSGNLATSYLESYGGGMYNKNSNPTIANCTFSGNSTHDVSGGIFNENSNPTIINCTFRGNSAHSGGGMFNSVSNPTIINCTFSGNTAADGGGIFNSFYSNPMITNCIFSGNLATSYLESYGGGILNTYHSSPTIRNCTFIGNSSAGGYVSHGGGMYNARSNPTITNCTFSENSAHSGGGIYNEDSNAMVSNCILWNNEPTEIFDDTSSSTIATYSDVQGGWLGTGNINTDPCFADPVGGDYHLKSQAGRWDPNNQSWVVDDVTSPCIDAGDPLSPIGLESFPNGGIINMGAYGGTVESSKSYFGKPPCEIIVAGDVNGDCVIDFLDFRLMALHWCEDNNP